MNRAARLHRIAHHFAMRADDAANSCDRLAFELFEVARLFAAQAAARCYVVSMLGETVDVPEVFE